MVEKTYNLDELADAFGLTPRNARHWIENILPPHHKTGRGKVARYGQDTWNCFAFVQRAREEKLTSAQIARVLGELGQDRIDRIAEGQEELAVVSMLSRPLLEESDFAPPLPGAPSRVHRRPSRAPEFTDEYRVFSPMEKESASSFEPRWRTLYADNTLRIQHRGEADRQQREQVRKAAELIRSILES